LSASAEFLGGGLTDVRTPLITYHSCRDTFTGQVVLFRMLGSRI